MTLNSYQIWTRTTAIYPPQEALEYLALGLSEETGEVAGKISKYIRDGTFNDEALLKEIGDVFWYLCRLADELGVDCEDILQRNKEKLESRLARGVLGGSGDTR
jgi:NTP pyrophosphatase (non-canonical NTP hydrolase)